MRNKNIAIVLLMLLTGQWGWTQQAQVRELSLDDCIRLAQGQSPEARIARKAYEAVHWSYKAFRGTLLPQVRLDVNTPGILRSISQITQPDGTQAFLQQNQAFSTANMSISQVISPTGGRLFLSSGLNRLDVFGDNGFQQYTATPLLIGLEQPLFGFNDLRWQRRIQPLRLRIAEKRYLESLEQIAVDISGIYFDVYIAQLRIANAEKNVAINDSIYNISEGRFNVGKIAENDLLQTELALLNSRADLRGARLDLVKARTNLAITLGFDDADEIAVLPPLNVPQVDIDIDFALGQARDHRSDMLDYEARGLEAESAVARARAESRFNANINATFGLNQTGGTVNEAYTQPLDRQTASIGVGLPILDWGQRKSRVESALVERERVREQVKLDRRRLERDVRFQVLDFQQLQEQLRISAKADTIARRRFEVAKNRYLVGKIDITNLQIAQGEKDNALISFVQVLRSFWTAYYALRRTTLYDFMKSMELEIPDLELD